MAPGSTTAGANFAEALYRVIHHALAASQDHPQEKVAALERNKQAFIEATNRVFPPSVTGNLFDTLKAVLPLIDDGTIPGMTRDLADLLEMVIRDPRDPNQETVKALVKLMGAKGVANTGDVAKLLGRMLGYPKLEELFRALATVIRENDGVDDLGHPNGERNLLGDVLGFLSRQLQGLDAGSAKKGGFDLAAELLRYCPVHRRGQIGEPAWAVRVDLNGNPMVRMNPSTRTLYEPFVDRNRDGAADINSKGIPIDRNGKEIDIPAFSDKGYRDRYGRALTAGGRLLYSYFDAKKTVMAGALLLASDLMEAEVQKDLIDVANALAFRLKWDNGTPGDPSDDYETFHSDNPLIDLGYGGLELFKYKDAPKLLRGLAELLRTNPQLAEDLFVSLGDVLRILEGTQIPANGRSTRQLLDDLIPLLDETFEKNGRSTSAARLLFQAFTSETKRLRGLPRGFARMMKYSDYKRKITTASSGQKSTFERLLDLMAEANTCSPWLIGNMAEFYLEVMAGQKKILGIKISINTVNKLIDISWIRKLLCSRISSGNVQALHAFAKSGALDSFIPIAKVFVKRGETKLLKNILLAMQKNYARGLRPAEPMVIEILESGAVERFFDAMDVMNRVHVPGSNEVLSDVVADATANLVDDDQVVLDRHGRRAKTLLHLLLDPLEKLGNRISAQGAKPALDRTMHSICQLLTDTVPGSGGKKLLKNRCLVDLGGALLRHASESMSQNATTRRNEVRTLQNQLRDFLTGRDFASLVDFVGMINSSSAGKDLYDAVINLITPKSQTRDECFGPLLCLSASLLQAKVDRDALVVVARFLGRVIDPQKGLVKKMTLGIVKLVQADGGMAVLGILRNLFDEGPLGADTPPVVVYLDIFKEIQAAAGGQGALTAQDLERQIASLVDFLRDDREGLEHFYGVIKNRRR
jgi:hypothetical protein